MCISDVGLFDRVLADMRKQVLWDDECERELILHACFRVVVFRKLRRVYWLQELEKGMSAGSASCGRRSSRNLFHICQRLSLECDHEVIKMCVAFESDDHLSLDRIMG